jgi:chromosome partitioning protein
MAKIITMFNLKGGTGKSTTTLFCSSILSEQKKVLLIDLDASTSLTSFLIDDSDEVENKTILEGLIGKATPEEITVKIKDNLDFIPATETLSDQDLHKNDFPILNLHNMLKGVKDKYDYIILDCPPHKLLETKQALAVSNIVISPTKLAKWDIRGLGSVNKLIYEENVQSQQLTNTTLEQHYILPTMVEKNTTLHQSYLQALEASYPGRVLPSIHKKVEVDKLITFGGIGNVKETETYKEYKTIIERVLIGVKA